MNLLHQRYWGIGIEDENKWLVWRQLAQRRMEGRFLQKYANAEKRPSSMKIVQSINHFPLHDNRWSYVWVELDCSTRLGLVSVPNKWYQMWILHLAWLQICDYSRNGSSQMGILNPKLPQKQSRVSFFKKKLCEKGVGSIAIDPPCLRIWPLILNMLNWLCNHYVLNHTLKQFCWKFITAAAWTHPFHCSITPLDNVWHSVNVCRLGWLVMV